MPDPVRTSLQSPGPAHPVAPNPPAPAAPSPALTRPAPGLSPSGSCTGPPSRADGAGRLSRADGVSPSRLGSTPNLVPVSRGGFCPCLASVPPILIRSVGRPLPLCTVPSNTCLHWGPEKQKNELSRRELRRLPGLLERLCPQEGQQNEVLVFDSDWTGWLGYRFWLPSLPSG